MDKTALIYCRVSSKIQERDGTSLDSQEAACVHYAQEHGYVVGRVSREVFSGAELWDRPILSRDRADLKNKRFQALVVYCIDRLSRDPIHLAILAEECERASVELIFVLEPLDNSDEADLIRYVKGFSAKKERERIRERSLRGKHQRVLSGKIHGTGPELYGYRRDKLAGVRQMYEPEAAVVRQIFALLVRDRYSYHQIAHYLNHDNAPAPGSERASGKRILWTANTVMRIVRNPAYKGEGVSWQYRALQRAGRAPTIIKRPEEEHVHLPPGVVPAIVSEEEWEEAQCAVRAQVGDRTRNEKVPYLLRGIVYCGECGRKMHASWQRRNGSNPQAPKVRTYRCSSYNSPTGACSGRQVRADTCEAWVWAQMEDIMRHPEIIEAELKRSQQDGGNALLQPDLNTARREMDRCEREQSKLIRQFGASDGIPAHLVEREVNRLETEKARWAETATDLEQRIARQDVARWQLEQVHTYCQRTAATFTLLTFEERVTVLQALDVRVTANGLDWSITGRVPIGAIGDVVSPILRDYRTEHLASVPFQFATLASRHTRVQDIAG